MYEWFEIEVHIQWNLQSELWVLTFFGKHNSSMRRVLLSSTINDNDSYNLFLNDMDGTLGYKYTSKNSLYLSCHHDQWALHWE